MSSDQCALDPDGSLKDARDIQWYNDPDDDQPLPPAPLGPPAVSPAEPLGRGRRNKVTSRFADAVARERLRSDDEDIAPARPPTRKRLVAPPRATAPGPSDDAVDTLPKESSDADENASFRASSSSAESGSESGHGSTDVDLISGNEVCIVPLFDELVY